MFGNREGRVEIFLSSIVQVVGDRVWLANRLLNDV